MKLKLRSSPRFLSSVFAGTGTAVRKDGLATYVDLDYGPLQALTAFDPSTKQIAVNDSLTGVWNKATLSDLLALSGYVATSLSPNTIALGPVSFTTQAGLAYRPGARVRASNVADTSKYMEGLVTSYVGTTLTVSISKVNGSGTFSNWNLSLAGDPGSGDMLSANNGLDFANLPTTLNNLTGVSFANTQTLSLAQKLKARTNIGLVGLATLNIIDFGGVGDGVTDNLAAFNSAYAALPARGGAIYFPAAASTYNFSAGVAKTLPNAQFDIAIVGDGQGSTALSWPNANGGIQLTASSLRNSFHIRDLSIVTSQVGGGNGLKFMGVGGGNAAQSDITNVTVSGDDLNGIAASSKYWSVAIWIHNWGVISGFNTNTYGPFNPAPGGLSAGTGVLIEGDAATTSYATIITFTACSFNAHNLGWQLGGWWQGVICNACNFNGALGAAAIQQNGGTNMGTLALLSIGAGCQFNYAGSQITIGTPIASLFVQNNTITNYTANSIGINAGGSTGVLITNNFFNTMGAAAGSYAAALNGATGVIVGNVVAGVPNGFNLQASSSNVTVGLNAYSGVTTKILNSGTGNSVGTAAAGNMAGVVP